MTTVPSLLLVSGAARSGTSALVNLLNTHPAFLIGQERYFFKFRRNEIAAHHFKRDRFLNMREGDTHNPNGIGVPHSSRESRFETAAYIGDKYPSLFRHFAHVFDALPEARHLYILRNPLSVVESYDARHRNPKDAWNQSFQDGMTAWNESVRRLADMPHDRRNSFVLVEYETLYAGPQAMNALFVRLGQEPLPEECLVPIAEKAAGLNNQTVPRRDDLRCYVGRHADWDAYRILTALIEGEPGKA